MAIPILNLELANDASLRPLLLEQLKTTLFNVGFLYVSNHGVPESTISNLADKLPAIFDLPEESKDALSKLNSAQFLGYSGFAQETTLGKQDLREQFDFATELPVIYQSAPNHEDERDFSKLYWRLRGPNQFPSEQDLPGFKDALLQYHDALAELSYRVVYLVEEAFGIPVGTFDSFFKDPTRDTSHHSVNGKYLGAQHRMKLVKYPPSPNSDGQGVGPHKDSSGWLTFLYQVGTEQGLEVLSHDGTWLAANPIPGTFVVNFGNAFEAATEGAVRATIHRVKAPTERVRYSIPFFMGLPLDLKVTDMRDCFPEHVRSMRRQKEGESAVETSISSFLDSRWDTLGESQLRKWIRSHEDVGLKWYGADTVKFYTQ